jgi:hypothetical protein
MEIENRFLRCVTEHRASLHRQPDLENRFCRLVAEERGYIPIEARRPWDVSESLIPNRVYYSPQAKPEKPVEKPVETPAVPSIPAIPASSIRVYYSTKAETPKPTESFLERYTRTMEQRKPQVVIETPKRPRQLSILSQESFPSLPSTSSPSASPVLKGWSDALKKNAELDGILVKPKPRVKTVSESSDTGEEEIVYDADGFPHLVLKHTS